MNPALLGVAWVLLLVFCGLGLFVFAVLVVLRLARAAYDRHVLRRRAEIRALLLDALMGEDDAPDEATAQLTARKGRRWTHVEDQAFDMLPKIKGDSRAALVRLLQDKGAADHALRQIRSVSSVRRCHGAFALGALGDPEHVDTLVPLLTDSQFLVRRVAVRALGNIGDPRAVVPLLEVIGEEPRLSRDLVYALNRIGAAGAADLRAEIQRGIDQPGRRGLHADLAATVLGLIDDFAAVPVLSRGLESDNLALAVACAQSLGMIGAPDSIPALVGALLSDQPALRVAAANALGALGSPMSADSLLDVVEENDPAVSRQAADALQKLGAAGMHLLNQSMSPYAVEAVALADLRSTVVARR